MAVTLSTPGGERPQRDWAIVDDIDLYSAMEDIVAEFRRTYDGDHLLDGCTITIEPTR